MRDRASYAFALVSAASLEVEDNSIKNVRLALGGVAHKPGRAFEAERVLSGAHGIGELGVTGVAAISNAIFNATGKRVRDLPITPDKLL